MPLYSSNYFTCFNMTHSSSLELSNLSYYVAGECFECCSRELWYFLRERAYAWFSQLPAHGEFFHFATARVATLISVDAVSLPTRNIREEKKKEKKEREARARQSIELVFLERREDFSVARKLLLAAFSDANARHWLAGEVNSRYHKRVLQYLLYSIFQLHRLSTEGPSLCDLPRDSVSRERSSSLQWYSRETLKRFLKMYCTFPSRCLAHIMEIYSRIIMWIA